MGKAKKQRIKINRVIKMMERLWLAEQLGKSYNMVKSYVQNRRQPSIEDLYKIAELLKVDARDLLTKSLNKNG